MIMKMNIHILLLLIFYVFMVPLIGQNNQFSNNATIVEEPALNVYAPSYYENQKNLWDENRRGSRDAQTWYNYYKAYRYASYSTTNKDISSKKQEELDNILREMKNDFQETYEYNYLVYWNGNHDISLYPYLEKAYYLNPENAEIFDDFIAYNEITSQKQQKKSFCNKLDKSEAIPDAVMDYNYNVLQSTEQKALIITNGYWDTYPLWIWQMSYSNRGDVFVLFTELLVSETYQDKLKSEIGLILPSRKYYERNKDEYITELCRLNRSKSIYLALTLDIRVLDKLSKNLYLTGLAFRYDHKGFNNMDVLQHNWEEKFKEINFESINKVGNMNERKALIKLYGNYMPAALLLYKMYLDEGNDFKAAEIKSTLDKLAALNNRKKAIDNYLQK